MRDESVVIIVPKDKAERIERILKEDTSVSGFTARETITYTADLGDGMEADIKICGVDPIEGETNYPWTEGVLFLNGSQIAYSEPDDEFFGEWDFEANGETYVVEVIKEQAVYASCQCPRCGKYKMEVSSVPGYAFTCTECDEDFYTFEIKKPGSDISNENGEVVPMLELTFPFKEISPKRYSEQLQGICDKNDIDYLGFDEYDPEGRVLDIGWVESMPDSDTIQTVAADVLDVLFE